MTLSDKKPLKRGLFLKMKGIDLIVPCKSMQS